MGRPKFIASVSFGKDSLATILLAKEHDEPLDEAVYCEVMFDKDISGEVPEHRDFIYDTAIPALERMGIKIIILRSEKTYVELFTGRVTRGPKKGMVRSFPICGKCAVQRDCKVRPIQRYQKTLPPGTVQYIGIAKDEQERLLRLEDGRQVSLLAKYNLTERDAWQRQRRAAFSCLRIHRPGRLLVLPQCQVAGTAPPLRPPPGPVGQDAGPPGHPWKDNREVQPHPEVLRHRRRVPAGGRRSCSQTSGIADVRSASRGIR